MGLEMDRELLEEFLNETGEILSQVERILGGLAPPSPDRDPPDAIARGFHTIKGGAGFFGLDTLVEICQLVEGAFDRRCQDRIRRDARLLDAVARALEQVKEMVEVLRRGEQPPPVGAALLSQLKELNEASRLFAETSRA